MRYSLLVSWRNLVRNKKRFLFTLLSLIVGVAVMTGMFISKETTIQTMEKHERFFAGNADFWIQGNKHFFEESQIEWVSEREEIEKGITSLLKQGFVKLDKGEPSQFPVRITGVSSFNNGLIELPVKEGDVSKRGVIITENASKLWRKGVGDTLTFQNMGHIEITAIVYEGVMLNSPKTLEEAYYRPARVMVPLEVLQEWTGMEGLISNYRFKVHEAFDDKHDEILELFQSELSRSDLFIQPIVMDGRQANDVEGFYYTADLIAILSIFISGFIAFNMIYASILERKREFAIMKSLGYTNGDVNQLVVRETGILAVIATMIGLPLGVGLGSFIQHLLMSAVASQNVVYELELVKPLLLSAIVGIVFPFIAAAFPIIQAGKTPILEAMFEKDANKSMRHKLSTLRIVLGILCTVIGLMDHLFALFILFVGLVLLYPLWIELVEKIIHPVFKVVFHFPGKLAIRSIKQFKNRNANTSAMLAIGVSLTLFMSALLDSLPEGMEEEIRRTYGGDILVTKETPWTDEELAFIKSIEEVDTVHTFADIPNITWKTIDGEYREFSIMSFSDELKTKFYMKEESNINSELPALYLGERALSEWGGKLGETITLNTPAGKVNFFVKGIVETSHYTNYVAFVSENELENILNWPAHFQLAISVQDEIDIHIVNSQLWQTFGDSISKLDSVIFEIEKTRNSLENMRELMHGLLILVIALSAIGISNTMFMNTIERIKEIGTMRAVGLTKGQVKLMIIAEGLVIGVSGVIIGTLYGILIIFLNTQSEKLQSLISFSVPWFSLILAISSGIVFTLIASWLPSITASKVPVKEAINYE